MNARDGKLLALRIGKCQPRAQANFGNHEITIPQLAKFHKTTPAELPYSKPTVRTPMSVRVTQRSKRASAFRISASVARLSPIQGRGLADGPDWGFRLA